MPIAMRRLERLTFATNAAPVPVLDYVSALGIRAVYAGMRLGVFEALVGRVRSAADLSADLGLDPRGVETMLDALASVGYVRLRGSGYAPSPMAAKWVPRFTQGVDFYEWMAGSGWDTLPQRLRGVAPADGSDRTWLADEGVADRVERLAGDFWTDELGSGYDIVLLCNLLNAYPDDRKRVLLSRAVAALAPGGRLVVHDQVRRAASAGTARAIVELTNLRRFDPSRGGTYAMPELLAWLSECGLRIVRAGPLTSVPWTALVIGGRSTQDGAR
jgi:SAM-dependent methyltransferase